MTQIQQPERPIAALECARRRTWVATLGFVIALGTATGLAQSTSPAGAITAREPAQLEQWKAERDVELRGRELDLRSEELRLKREEANATRWSSPLVLAIVGLAATLLVNIVKAGSDAKANRVLERQRFESTLIQKAVETLDADQAAKRLKFLVDLGWVRDDQKKIAAYVSKPESIPLQPPVWSDTLVAPQRASAKLSIGTLAVQEFPDFTALRKSWPEEPDEAGDQMLEDMPRSDEEQRNVAAPVYVYAAKSEIGHDFRLIIGPPPDAPRKDFISAIVSGLPTDVGHPSYATLSGVREAFKKLFPDIQKAGAGYVRFNPPRLVRISGSLYSNSQHPPGSVGPKTMRPDTQWEVRPITAIALPGRSK